MWIIAISSMNTSIYFRLKNRRHVFQCYSWSPIPDNRQTHRPAPPYKFESKWEQVIWPETTQHTCEIYRQKIIRRTTHNSCAMTQIYVNIIDRTILRGAPPSLKNNPRSHIPSAGCLLYIQIYALVVAAMRDGVVVDNLHIHVRTSFGEFIPCPYIALRI